MHHRKHVFLTALAVTILYAAAAPGQTLLRFQFKENEKLAYEIEQKTKSTMNLMGQDIVSTVNSNMSLLWEVVKVESDGSAQVRVRVTHSKMSMDSLLGMVVVDSKDKDGPGDPAGKMLAQANKAIAAMEITATMLPTGEMKDIKVSEATTKAIKALPGAEQIGDLAHPDNFRDMLSSVVFAKETVTKGKSWTHNTETQTSEGKTTTEHVFTLEDPVEKDGVKLDRIALKPKIKIESAPKALLKVKSATSSGEALFDNKTGRFVESTIKQTKVGKLDVMGLTLDSTSEQTTIMKLKVQTAAEKLAEAKKIVAVKIDESEFVEKEAAKELLETIQGVARSFTVERSFAPAISMTGSATVSDELKAKVESMLGITIGKKATVKESITLDGKDTTKVNVVWVERYRRGEATLGDGSRVAILVKVGLRLKLEKAK
jgi:hypothetical protein